MVQSKFYHLDRITVCYKAPSKMYESLYSEDNLDFGDFKMVRKTKDLTKLMLDIRESGSKTFREYTRGEYHPRQFWIITVPNNEYCSKSLLLGEISFDENLDPYDRDNVYVFLKLDNSFLYHDQQGLHDGDYIYDISNIVKNIEVNLQLECNGVSYAEVACDVPFDPITRMIALFRSGQSEVIVKNKTVKDRSEQINNLHFEAFTSLDEFTKTHCRIKNNGKNELYMYNKSEAIEQQDKQYIYRDYNIEPTALWRMEVRIDNEYSKNFCKKHKCSPAEFLHTYLLTEDNLPHTWDYYSRKFIRFKWNRRHIDNPLQALEKVRDYSVVEVLPTADFSDALATPLGNATSIQIKKEEKEIKKPSKPYKRIRLSGRPQCGRPKFKPIRLRKQHKK